MLSNVANFTITANFFNCFYIFFFHYVFELYPVIQTEFVNILTRCYKSSENNFLMRCSIYCRIAYYWETVFFIIVERYAFATYSYLLQYVIFFKKVLLSLCKTFSCLYKIMAISYTLLIHFPVG